MSPRTKRQFDEMRTKSRDAIMQSALELFTHKGYHGTSVSMIANHAGVSTGLMYNYFKSKNELLEAIVRDGMSIIESFVAEIDEIDDPREKIAASVEMAFDIARQDMHFWTLYFSVIMQPDIPEDVRNIFSSFIQNMFNWLESICEQLGCDNPEIEARILSAILDGAILHCSFVGEDYPIEEVKRKIIKRYHGERK